MPLRLDELAKTIDLTLPSPKAPARTVVQLCESALELHFASVCVLPAQVATAAGILRGHDVKVAAVIGFPLGSQPLPARVAAAERSVEAGADELELVLNVPAMLSGDFPLVRDELLAVARAGGMKGTNGRGASPLLKVVVECSRLDEKRKRLACRIAESAGADFVQTASGFGAGGTTAYDVELLRECLSDGVAVKASGGIESVEDVYAMLDAGAGRVGTSAAVEIMNASSSREPV